MKAYHSRAIGILLSMAILFVSSCKTDENPTDSASPKDDLNNATPTNILLLEGDGDDFDIGAERFLGDVSGEVLQSSEPSTIIFKDPHTNTQLTQENGLPYEFQTYPDGTFDFEATFAEHWFETPIAVEIFPTSAFSVNRDQVPSLKAILFFDRAWFKRQATLAHAKFFPSALSSLYAHRLSFNLNQGPLNTNGFLISQIQFENLLGLENAQCANSSLAGIQQTNLSCSPNDNWQSLQVNTVFENATVLLVEGFDQKVLPDSLFRQWATTSSALTNFDPMLPHLTLLASSWQTIQLLPEVSVRQSERLSLLLEGASGFLEQLSGQIGPKPLNTDNHRFLAESQTTQGSMNQRLIAIGAGKSNLLHIAKYLAPHVGTTTLPNHEFKIYAQSLMIQANQNLDNILKQPKAVFENLTEEEINHQIYEHRLSSQAVQTQWQLVEQALSEEQNLITQLSSSETLALNEIEPLVSWELELLSNQALANQVIHQVNAQITSPAFLTDLKAQFENHAIAKEMHFDTLIGTVTKVLSPILNDFIDSLDPDHLANDLSNQTGESLDQVTELGHLTTQSLELIIQLLGDSSPTVLKDIFNTPEDILDHINTEKLLKPLCKDQPSPCIPPAFEIRRLQAQIDEKFKEFKTKHITITFKTTSAFWNEFDLWYEKLEVRVSNSESDPP